MLRPIELTDAATLKKINAEQLGYDFPLELTHQQLSKLIKDQHHYFLIYEDDITNEVAGYLHAEVYESLYSLPMFNVLALAVDKKFSRKGIGKQLMIALEEEAQKRNFERIRLNSGEKRTQAHKFYEAIGYTSDKSQKRFLKTLQQNQKMHSTI
ncbi:MULTISPECIES: GNAT family N-acetyltransferase [Lactobacillales]|uniref:GNAT family N-acetyltransferase n=1 Tax=Aerococcus urinaeequi TaxID=51665 RepID=A0A7M1KUX3_9LACT|nr:MULTISPECIES: GNAT family N-acetyltransferase [Lactobacillales]MDT2752986.1 GNAT family N-acetyltransferase [Enterococcus thailandicus]QOQ80146.1 GNAT family N-acetyltransferase [Aerococcus urinaeequi]